MAYLKKIKIKHYKSFGDQQVIDFVYPSTDTDVKGLNIIVGPNNSGKSTIFDALLKIIPDKTIPKQERHEGEQTEIVLVDDQDRTVTLSNIDNGHHIDKTGDADFNEQTFDYIPSRRYWAHKFSGSIRWSIYNGNNNKRDKHSADGNLGKLLGQINKDPSAKRKFNSVMRKMVPEFRKWTIDSFEDGREEYVSYTTASGAEHNTSLLGDGIISLFRIVASLTQEDSHILIVDEPELSLHPQVLKKLVLVLSEASKTKQIILSTHSPYLVNWSDVVGGARIIRVSKSQKDLSEVNSLGIEDASLDKITGLQDYQKPMLLDSVAKEVFFSRAILFVEGQEDVGLINKYIVDNGIDIKFDIFGYGSGGAHNIEFFLDVSNKLGIKAGALFDKDKNELCNKCQQMFSDSICKTLSTDDIRDKYKRDASRKEDKKLGLEKVGLFNSKGEIKGESEKIELNALIEEFNNL